MVRKLRLEFPGACYHVINRGNYRADLFRTKGAKQAFESCLFDACAKSGWRLHAYVLMSNHYHLALETPEGSRRWLKQQTQVSNRWLCEHLHMGTPVAVSHHVGQGRRQANHPAVPLWAELTLNIKT